MEAAIVTQRCWNWREQAEQTAFISNCYSPVFIGLIFMRAME
jgi:hypothetical protein